MAALEEQARQMGWDLDIDQNPYSQMRLDAVEQAVEEAEFLHPKALNLSQRANNSGGRLRSRASVFRVRRFRP